MLVVVGAKPLFYCFFDAVRPVQASAHICDLGIFFWIVPRCDVVESAIKSSLVYVVAFFVCGDGIGSFLKQTGIVLVPSVKGVLYRVLCVF